MSLDATNRHLSMKLGLVNYLSYRYVRNACFDFLYYCDHIHNITVCFHISGLNIVEQSLWKAVPHYLRRVSNALKKVCPQFSTWCYQFLSVHVIVCFPSCSCMVLSFQHTGKPLPLTCTPIKFGSWMGGDRDGNPNVTAKVRLNILYFLLVLGLNLPWLW